MSPELEHLIQLQNLESAIAEARAHITAHPQRLAEADARLAEADRVVQEAAQKLKDAQKARGDSEKDAAVYQGRLTKFKDQLSAVKTNREYTAMQHEIETAQKDLGAAEEKVLERMMEIDQLTADVKQAEAAKAAEKKTVDADKAAFAAELAADEKTLVEKTAARTALVDGARTAVDGALRAGRQSAEGRGAVDGDSRRPLLGLSRADAAAGVPAGAAERQRRAVRQLPADPLLGAAARADAAARHDRVVSSATARP